MFPEVPEELLERILPIKDPGQQRSCPGTGEFGGGSDEQHKLWFVCSVDEQNSFGRRSLEEKIEKSCVWMSKFIDVNFFCRTTSTAIFWSLLMVAPLKPSLVDHHAEQSVDFGIGNLDLLHFEIDWELRDLDFKGWMKLF